MPFQILKIGTIILILLLNNLNLLGQSIANLGLKRVRPYSWLSILVPKSSNKFQPHGSVDGGDINSKEIEIEFNYWQNGGAPLYIRNTIDANSEPLILVRSDRFQTKIWNTLIDGKKAIAQTYFDKKDSVFVYHATFPRLKVPNDESGKFRYGRFNLTITYKNKSYLEVVKKISNSLKFNSF